MRKSTIIFFFFSLLITFGCSLDNSKKIEIQGVIKESSAEKIILRKLLPKQIKIIDSCLLDKNGNFKINIKQSDIGVYELLLDKKSSLILILSPKENVFIDTKKDFYDNSLTISGSPESEKYFQFTKVTNENSKIIDSLMRKHHEIKSLENYYELKRKIDKGYIKTTNSQANEIKQFVNNNISSFSSLLVINSKFFKHSLVTLDSDYSIFKSLSDSLIKHYPSNDYVINLENNISNFDSLNSKFKSHLKPGDFASDIVLPDLENNQKSLLKSKGKIKILLFWDVSDEASRQYNQLLQEFYLEYRNKGLEIFSVSFENDLQSLKEAIKRDKAYWTQVVASSENSSAIIENYNIGSFPKIFVLNEEGKITYINPTYIQLKELLFNTFTDE